MRTCDICSGIHSEKHFAPNGGTTCEWCATASEEGLRLRVKESHKRYEKERGVRDRSDYYATREVKRTARLRAVKAEYFANGCTTDGCDEARHACLDFHHIDPSTKLFSIAQFKGSTARLREEIAKCVVWCSNCHRCYHAPCEE